MRYRLITFLIFGAILVGVGEWNVQNQKPGPLKTLNDLWLEFCVGNSGGKIKQPSVTLVRIDDEYKPLTLGAASPNAGEGPPQKLSRLDFATILALVGKQKPKAVSFIPSPVFDNKNPLNQTDISPLKDAALQLPRMTLGTVVSGDKAPANAGEKIEYQAIKVIGDTALLPALTRTVRMTDPQLLANGDAAFSTIESFPKPQEKGAALRVPLVAKQGSKIVPSFVLRSVATQAGIGLDKITLNLESPNPFIQVGDLFTIPVGNDGAMEVPAHGGLKGSMTKEMRNDDGKKKDIHYFTSVTADELAYTGKADDEVAKRILAKFEGKFESVSRNLVVVGLDRKVDRRIPTSSGEMISDSSLLARAIATIQSGRFIKWWPQWGRWLAVLAIFAVALFLFRLSRGKVVLFGGIAVLIFFTICVFIFKSTLTWTPPFVMFSLFGLALAVGLILPRSHQDVEVSDGD